MSKGLIVEYMPFKPVGSLKESTGDQFGVPGGFVVQGVLQRAGAKIKTAAYIQNKFCKENVYVIKKNILINIER
jgi:tRNA U34 2-thiouridine synthase MnmA/TrmU